MAPFLFSLSNLTLKLRSRYELYKTYLIVNIKFGLKFRTC